MTTEVEFQRALDANPDDWQTRLALADWLDAHGDPRAAGYRAMVVQRKYPLQGHKESVETWWWHQPHEPFFSETRITHNAIPQDWFALLPVGEGNEYFWPAHRGDGRGIKSRWECEDALAFAFAELPPERQRELLSAPLPAVPASATPPEAVRESGASGDLP